MDDDAAHELIAQMESLNKKIGNNNTLQDEANIMMRELIDALNTNSQELLELKRAMLKK